MTGSLPYFTIIRILALGTTLILRKVFEYPFYRDCFYALLFAHYIVSAVYSRQQVRHLSQQHQLYPFLGIVVGLGFFMALFEEPDLSLYFGIHHAFSEGFMLARAYRGTMSEWDRRFLCASRIVLTFCVYCFAIRHDFPYRLWSLPVLQVMFGASIFVFVVAMLRVRKSLPREQFSDILLFETIGIGCGAAVSGWAVYFMDAVFYHLFMWVFIPLRKMGRLFATPSLRYMGLTTVFFLAILIVTPDAGRIPLVTAENLYRSANFFGYLHITATFTISRFNPGFLVRFFFPGEPSVTPVAVATPGTPTESGYWPLPTNSHSPAAPDQAS